MSIDANRAYQLARTAKAFGASGIVGTLGVQTVTSDADAINRAARAAGCEPRLGKSFFERLGLTGVESIDVSDFEGATHLFDLNNPSVPEALIGRFGWVFNGGTIEHVFDVPAARRSVFQMLALGGLVTHGGPVNGWVDHGFYQFSPTLFLDYYFANRFDILEAWIVEADKSDPALWRVTSYTPGCLDGIGTQETGGIRWNVYFSARKTTASTCTSIPQQSYYQRIYGSPSTVAAAPHLAKAAPYALRGGEPLPMPVAAPHQQPRRWRWLRR